MNHIFRFNTFIPIFLAILMLFLFAAGALQAEETAPAPSAPQTGITENKPATVVGSINTAAGSSESGGTSSPSAGGSQYTGSATAAIPIVAAPGRSEATTPQLALTYSSSRGNDFAGMGWDLNLGYIKRSYATSILDYLKTVRDPIHLVTDSGSQELVPDKENISDHEDAFRFLVREGIAPKIRSSWGTIHDANPQTLHWTVSNPDGARYSYGSTETSRLVVYTNIIREAVSRYYLDRVEDPDGYAKTQTKNALGRVIRKTADTETLARYTYDGAVSNGRGRLAAVSRGEVTDRIEGYDTMGRILKGTRTFAGPSGHPGKSYTTLSRYDVSGRLAELTYPDGYRVRYGYYPGTGLLKDVTGSDGVAYAGITDYGTAGQVSQVEATGRRPGIPTRDTPCVCRGS